MIVSVTDDPTAVTVPLAVKAIPATVKPVLKPAVKGAPASPTAAKIPPTTLTPLPVAFAITTF